MDTIALIISYIALLTGTVYFGLWQLCGILVVMLGVVLLGEYISIRKTGKTISKNFCNMMPRVKRIIVVLMWVFIAALSWHFLS